MYKATRTSDGLTVAFKLAHGQEQPFARDCIRIESSIISVLNHPHIVKMLDAGETVTGNPYIVTEFLPGYTLGKLLRLNGALGLERSVSICLQVAETMQYVHKMGIAHNDLKPENIMILVVGDQELAYLLDFGISSSPEDPRGEGSRAGTLLFMSPEQMHGLPTDYRSDVYQLGLILLNCLFGGLPFEETIVDAIRYRLTGATIPEPLEASLCAMPHAVRQVLHRSLVRKRDERRIDMASFAAALRSAVASTYSLCAA